MDRFISAALSFYFPKLKFEDFEKLTGSGEPCDQLLESLLKEKPKVIQQVEKDLQILSNVGAKVTLPGDCDYPSCLLRSLYPPLILTYFGAPVWQSKKMISVVGSREPSQDSYRWMDRHLATFLEKNHLVTVSGGARGIDQKVHQISMRLDLPTVAFLPSGLLKPYPIEMADWIEQIVKQGGAVVSEFSPYSPMYKSHFFRRNRMIASISDLLLVVEARLTGGSMMTAQWALNQGRTVATIPAFPDDERYAGNNKLIVDGAAIVLGEKDLSLLMGLSA